MYLYTHFHMCNALLHVNCTSTATVVVWFGTKFSLCTCRYCNRLFPNPFTETYGDNAVKGNLTKITAKSSWYFRSAVFVWHCRLSALCHCTCVFSAWRSLERFVRRIEQFPAHLWSIFQCLSAPPLSSLSSLFTQCDGCLEDCMGTHGWVAGIASHGWVMLSRGRLVTVEVTVEVPGYPRCPSSRQHDVVVNHSYNYLFTLVLG